MLCAAILAPALATAADPPRPRRRQHPRREPKKDLLGEKQVPANAYYGVQTLRGIENFQISGVLINHYPGYVEAWAIVKLAAARANTEVGAMKRTSGDDRTCKAVMDGSTTISSWSIGTRAAPARRPT